MRLLSNILGAAGLNTCLVTSTSRTPAEQARVMFDNIACEGVASQKALYAAPGEAVIEEYVRAKRDGKNRAQTIAAMEAKIRALGPSTVSRHCADPSRLNVIDIAPSSVSDRPGFGRAVRAALARGAVSKFITPGNNDPAYHVEIPQPAAGRG
jgi:hypothetical protein